MNLSSFFPVAENRVDLISLEIIAIYGVKYTIGRLDPLTVVDKTGPEILSKGIGVWNY